MTVSIKILPLSSSIDMYGEPETSTAYSLSGQVAISVSPHYSFFDISSPSRLLLKSLILTFEGQSELIDNETGYTALRLCEVQRELAPSELMELSDDGQGDSGKPCIWNFVFDIPIPGWLPASSVFGCDTHGEAGTRYGLYAKAVFINADDDNSQSWLFATLCSPFISRTRTVQAEMCDITVNRLRLPPVISPSSRSLFPMSSYAVQTHIEHRGPGDYYAASRIPTEVLSKTEVLVSIPECISLDELSIPITVHLRAPGLEKVHQERLRLSELVVELIQFEKYRTSPTARYTSCFPLPPASSQPPLQPLRSPHYFKTLTDLGLVVPSTPTRALTESFSILPASQSGHYKLAGDGRIFIEDEEDDSHPWFKMDVDVPIAHIAAHDDRDWETRHGRIKRLRATETSPLLSVWHEMEVKIACIYDRAAEGLEPATENLHFRIPLRFASVASASTSPLSSPTHSAATSVSSLHPPPVLTHSGLAMPAAHPYASSLPAYSQLFHSNGDRKIDYSTPLPIYTPSSSASTIDMNEQSVISAERAHGEKALGNQGSSISNFTSSGTVTS